MDSLIVALDVDTAADALALAARLRGAVGAFKIGSRLFTGEGPSVVEHLAGLGDRVFLDLKFHDIPHTVAGAVAAATRLGVWMLNVHASGGSAMMRAARDAAENEAVRMSQGPPLVIAVTVLTSLDDEALAETGVAAPLEDQVDTSRSCSACGARRRRRLAPGDVAHSRRLRSPVRHRHARDPGRVGRARATRAAP